MSQIYSLNDFIPQLPKDNQYWVADTARIVGNVIINELVSIWFGAVVRGDNERIFLGSGSNIQENCVLHTDIGYPLTVYSNCTIGHGAILHGCTVKESSLIGMGSVILNGAEVGKNCIVGAGSLITEDKIVPDGVLIMGSPAKVIRNLDKHEVNGVRKAALIYQEKIKIFREKLIVRSQRMDLK